MKNFAEDIKKNHTNPSCSDDANLQHLIHLLAGYRAFVTNDDELQPYAPGNARQFSFDHGVALAKGDLAKMPEKLTKTKNNMYDINSHGDFKRYFDITKKRNYWVLGYFGGGSVNVVDAYNIAQQMSTKLNVPLNSIHIDEILCSSRHKNFKFIYSMAPDQIPEPECTNFLENVYAWLTD